jgi:hypothetical protein
VSSAPPVSTPVSSTRPPLALCAHHTLMLPHTCPLCAGAQFRVVGEPSGDLHAPTSLYLRSSKEMFKLKEHVTNICFECFRCFKNMLQVFYINVAKVNRDVTICVHVCCKGLLLIFHLCFRTYVANVFICKLHMFHTYVAYVYKYFQVSSSIF